MNLKDEEIMKYLGFGIKARKIRLGSEQIMAARDVKIILIADDLNESVANKLMQFAKHKNISCVTLGSWVFTKLLGGKNVKVVALTDENLANAINKIA